MRFWISLLFTSFFNLINWAQATNKAQLVNPLIGTGGHGHTYPGVSAPFGFMQLSPDSRTDGWDGCSGYHYSDSVILGFSHTHLSGTGISDLADVLIMPFTGENVWHVGNDSIPGYQSQFSHQNEHAEAGYYQVFLEDPQVNVELSALAHSGMHHYEYQKNENKKIIIDLEHRDYLLDVDLQFINDSTLIGKRISKAWAKEQHLYFVIQLSEKPMNRLFYKNKHQQSTKVILEFSNSTDLYIKTGISAVDIQGALKNLQAEIPHWDFNALKLQAQDQWKKELNKIDVFGGESGQDTTFYTALYHSFLAPNLFSDVDGRYRGMDQKIHHSSQKQYTVFSLWDTFRAAHPLYTLVQPEKDVEFIQTFLRQYQDGGILPIWELDANYTNCMIGYHSIPVITDAFMKGLTDFDTPLALKAMIHSAMLDHYGLDAYKKQGFISSEDESENVSKTLEYAYDDWCIAILAEELEQDSISRYFYQRAANYRNLYQPDSKFMQPKRNGAFKPDFNPKEVTFDFTEANAWQYSLFAPHDIEGLIELIGGPDSLELWLDQLFSQSSETDGRHQADITGLIGQYAHGNEPSHHMTYLYNYTPHAYKTQTYTHQILTQLYHNAPDGLSGNEDCGQMSAWYVLSSMGFYSVTPGSPYYSLTSPLFDSIYIHLDNGNTFEIHQQKESKESIYIQSIRWNGQPFEQSYLSHFSILNGGRLDIQTVDSPAKNIGPAAPSRLKGDALMVPYCGTQELTFEKSIDVTLHNPNQSSQIFYQINGGKIKAYQKPIRLKKSSEVVYWAQNQNGIKSPQVKSTFVQLNTDWTIELVNAPYPQYQGNTAITLIDLLKGSTDFRTGFWQGFYKEDMIAIIDFHKKQKISQISCRFLQDANSWIWMPSEVIFYGSQNGNEWEELGRQSTQTDPKDYDGIIETFSIQTDQKVRYLKVVGVNPGPCPEWHPGAGYASFIFADEISVN